MTEYVPHSADRRATPGELCTCGRPALVVFVNEEFGEIGYCGLPDVVPVSPCPFCGSNEPHRAPWGDPQRCPDYRLSPPGGDR